MRELPQNGLCTVNYAAS